MLKKNVLKYLIVMSFCVFFVSTGAQAQMDSLYRMRDDVQSRWISFENPGGEKGQGGKENKGAKGAAFSPIPAGKEVTLMDVEGAGVIHRMWFTVSKREPKMLRSIVLRMYWDNAESPAVEVPFGDFFGAILGEMTTFESALFSSPEGRSFNRLVPMPFRTHARITFANESDEDLKALFYDINYSLTGNSAEDSLYFHASWRRERWTKLEEDFAILPRVSGRGRFLGAHIGVIGHPDNLGWWGEGEVKVYLDGDDQLPTLVGTGTEDYVGTAYGQGVFSSQYQGSLMIDTANQYFSFYRHHMPDPIYFQKDIRVTIQQMGGAMQEYVREMMEKGVEIKPVSVHTDDSFTKLLDSDPPKKPGDPDVPYGWTNYYRRDDVSAVALFYLDSPVNGLPRIAPLAERTIAVGERNEEK